MLGLFKKWIKDNSEIKKKLENYQPKEPREWWIDDLSNRVCAPVDHPVVGLETMPWPDYEHVYIAIDKEEYKKLQSKIAKITGAIDFDISQGNLDIDSFTAKTVREVCCGNSVEA